MEFNKLYIGQVEGDLYSRSYKLGKIYKDTIQESCKTTNKLLEDSLTRETLDIVRRKLEKIYPQYLEEAYGKADGAEVDRNAYLLFICYEIYTERESCTDIIVKLDNDTIIGGHNEDGDYSLKNTGLIKYITDYGFLCEYFCTDTLPGSTFCWNSHGLIFTCNYVYVYHKNKYGIPTWFILRDLVDCKSIEEVEKHLNIDDAASGCNVNIIDTNTKKAYSIEWRLNNSSIIEVTDKFAHSNHFTRKEVGFAIANSGSNSKFRLEKSNELLNNKRTQNEYDILNILQYHTSNEALSIRDTVVEDDGRITSATFIYNSNKQFKIYSYLDKSVYQVDYDMNNLLK